MGRRTTFSPPSVQVPRSRGVLCPQGPQAHLPPPQLCVPVTSRLVHVCCLSCRPSSLGEWRELSWSVDAGLPPGLRRDPGVLTARRRSQEEQGGLKSLQTRRQPVSCPDSHFWERGMGGSQKGWGKARRVPAGDPGVGLCLRGVCHLPHTLPADTTHPACRRPGRCSKAGVLCWGAGRPVPLGQWLALPDLSPKGPNSLSSALATPSQSRDPELRRRGPSLLKSANQLRRVLVLMPDCSVPHLSHL